MKYCVDCGTGLQTPDIQDGGRTATATVRTSVTVCSLERPPQGTTRTAACGTSRVHRLMSGDVVSRALAESRRALTDIVLP